MCVGWRLQRKKEGGGLDGEIWKCRKKTIMLYVFPLCPHLSLSVSLLRLSFPLVLLVFIVITTAAPLESSTFFSTGAINEEGLTPSSSSSSPFSSLLQVPARLLSHLLPPSSQFSSPHLQSSSHSFLTFLVFPLFFGLLDFHISVFLSSFLTHVLFSFPVVSSHGDEKVIYP